MSNKNHKVIYSVMLLTLLTMFVPSRALTTQSLNQNDSLDTNQTQLETQLEPQSETQTEIKTPQDHTWVEYEGRRKNSLTTDLPNEWHYKEEFYSEFLKRKFSGLETPTPVGDEIIPIDDVFKHISPINVIEEKLPTITFPATHPESSNNPFNLTEMFTDFVALYNSDPTTTSIDKKIEEDVLEHIPFLNTNEILITDTYDNNSSLPEDQKHQFQVKTEDGFDGIVDFDSHLNPGNPDSTIAIEFWETDKTELDGNGNIVSADDVSHGGWDKATLNSFCSSGSCDTGVFMPWGTWGWEKLEKDSIYNITINYQDPTDILNSDKKNGAYVFEYGSSAKDQDATSDIIWNSEELYNEPPSSYIEPLVTINQWCNDGTEEGCLGNANQWMFTVELQTYDFPYTETFIDDISFVDYPYWFNSTTTENAVKFKDSSGKVWDDNLNLMAPWIDVYLITFPDGTIIEENDPIEDLPIEELRLIHSEMLTNTFIDNPITPPSNNDPSYSVDITITDSDLLGTGVTSFAGVEEDHLILDVNWHAKYSHPMPSKTGFNFQNNSAWITSSWDVERPYIFNFSDNSNNIKIDYIGDDKFRFIFEITIFDPDEANNREIIYRTGNDANTNNMWRSTNPGANNYIISKNAQPNDVEEFEVDIQIADSVSFIQFGVANVEVDETPTQPLGPNDNRSTSIPKAYFRNSIMISDIKENFVGADWKITFDIWAPDDMIGKKLWWKDDQITRGKYIDNQTYHGLGEEGEEDEEPHCIFEGGNQQMTITIKSSVWEKEFEVGQMMEFTLGASEIGASEVDTKTLISTNVDNANETIVIFPEMPPTEKDKIVLASIIVGLTAILLFGVWMFLIRLKYSKTNRLIIESLGNDAFNVQDMEEDFDLSL